MQTGMAGMPEDGNPGGLSYKASDYNAWTRSNELYDIDFEEVCCTYSPRMQKHVSALCLNYITMAVNEHKTIRRKSLDSHF